MLHKNLPNSVKDVDAAQGVVCGYASSFNVVDDGNDMVLPGAFDRSIKEWGPGSKQPRIKFLYQHDTTAILGVPQVLKEDGFGLYFEVKIAPTSLGRDVLTLYQSDCITEHSIGYETVTAEWDRAKAVRLLRDLKLYECSAVTFGMNSETPTVAVKSLADPSRLSAMADQAARLDSILHSGTLRSDALCETLERELKALHAALAPSQAASERPYTIQGVIESMNDLKSRLDGSQTKAATQADKDAQEARSKKYGIGIKDGGSVTKPGQWKALDDSDFGDPVNYRYPMPDKAHADNAASRFGAETARAEYTKAEQAIIDKRIAAAQKQFGEDDKDDAASSDGGKAAQQMATRMVKGSGGDMAVSADGTHAAYTGTHTHSHKAMGSQGGDVMHEHEHSHKGNANHGHDHTAVDGTETASDATSEQESGEPVKARRRDKRTYKQHLAARQRKTFAEHYQEQQCSDLLRDWQDVVLAAFTSAVYDAFQIGDEPASDISDALDGLKDAVTDWVDEAIKYGLSGYLDAQGYDGGTAYQMQNGTSGGYDAWGYMSRTPLAMPDAPATLRKAGRQISGANRAVITDALDGMSEAMKSMKAHHGAIADLMTKTDPDAVRQDEDNTQGDDDTDNGGTDPNKSRLTDPVHRTAAARPARAGTTHHNGASNPIDLSAIVADLDALKGRLAAHAAR